MGFFTSEPEENTEEGIHARMKKEKMLYVQRLIDKDEYEKRIMELEAHLAALSVAPPQDSNVEVRLADLKYLFDKQLITQEDYDTKKKEILGEL